MPGEHRLDFAFGKVPHDNAAVPARSRQELAIGSENCSEHEADMFPGKWPQLTARLRIPDSHRPELPALAEGHYSLPIRAERDGGRNVFHGCRPKQPGR